MEDNVVHEIEAGRYETDWQMMNLLEFTETVKTNLRADINPTVAELITHFQQAATSYYARGIGFLQRQGRNDNAFIRRRLVERVGDEWANLMALVTSAQMVLTYDGVEDTAVQTLRHVIDAAWRNLQLDDSLRSRLIVLPHFGRHFELVTFHYAPQIRVMGIPVTSLYSPWEWSMVWHEAAGVYIHTERAQGVITAVDNLLKKGVWGAWRQRYGAEMAHLPAPDSQNEALLAAVQRNWAEEFIEDAVVALCLGETAVIALQKALELHYDTASYEDSLLSKARPRSAPPIDFNRPEPQISEIVSDLRHPLPHLRIALVRQLSALMNGGDAAVNDDGVRYLADVIWTQQGEIVNTTFSARDQAQTAAIIDRLRDDVPAPMAQTEPIAPHVLIPAAMHAFYDRQLSAHAIRQFVYANCQAADRQQGVDSQKVDRQGRAALTGFTQLLEELSQSWETLRSFAFSQTDQATASESGSHQHQNQNGSKAAYAVIHYSGLVSHAQSHSGTLYHYHIHS